LGCNIRSKDFLPFSRLPDKPIDIDDTIKITQTSDPIGILRSTFVSPATPIQGMPELYTYIREVIKPSSPFFYLSASPYNLYPFLRDFREKFYPDGTVILRDASWMNLSGLLSNLTLGTQAYKIDRMEKIYSWLPHRKMICVGDSTQSDPEAYGEIYRRHAGWIRLILIRKVLDIAAVGMQEKNQPARFEKAFESIPPSAVRLIPILIADFPALRETSPTSKANWMQWHVFETPEECYQLIGDAVRCEP
jgi:phosphatidate phosphatase APP1